MDVPYLDFKKSYAAIRPELNAAYARVIISGYVILGTEVSQFEKLYAKFSGIKHAVGVANGLDAIILSLASLGIGPGDEVIVPSNTYIATLIAVSRLGATPVPVEPKIDTYNIDPQKISAAITKRTRAIIPVHLYGQACKMDEIMAIAKKHHLAVVEDNAQSHGAKYDSVMTGTYGDVNATSFYPGKNLGAIGDAGAITTDDDKLFEKISRLRNYGETKKYYNDIIGYNSRLDELQAAFLKIRLSHLGENNKKRSVIAKRYTKELSKVGDIVLPVIEKNATSVYHVFAIRTKKRDDLRDYLGTHGVRTLIHYPVPPHLQSAYAFLGYKKGSFPIAEELANTMVSLPIYPELSETQQSHVIGCVRKYYSK
jgi:dTDP-4-amino-4,6-dideoxygalactose transaminase